MVSTSEPTMTRAESGAAKLTGGSLLARNTAWSLLGQVLPMIAAFLVIPRLVHVLGTESFAILTIAWTALGYFTLLDLGLGRSLTQMVAERLGRDDDAELTSLVWTSMLLLLGFSIVGGVAMVVATPLLVHGVFHVPGELEHETVTTFHLLAFSLPALLLTAGLGGVLAAYQRFGVLNLLRVPLGVLAYVGPLAVLPFSRNLAYVVGVIVVVRYVGLLGHLLACQRIGSMFRLGGKWNGRLAGPLMQRGGWIALINGLVPLFASFDRFLVGAWRSLAEVAYYAAPQEVAIRLWGIPGPLVNVLFPAFAASHQVDRERLRLLFWRGLKFVFCAMFPVTIALVVLSGEILRTWLGVEFEHHGGAALQLLVTGAFFTGLSYVPSALLQAVGRPRQVGLFFLIQLPFYLLGMWWGIRTLGVTGAALAWSARALVDLLGILFLASRSLGTGFALFRRLVPAALLIAVTLAAALVTRGWDLIPRAVLLALVLAGFLAWVWRQGLADERRALLRGFAARP
jgi:O-antigen/teichoic acid export membrane protein